MTTTRDTLREIGTRIMAATNLSTLRDALNEFEAEFCRIEGEIYDADFENVLAWAGVDMCGMPTFGGHDPLSTMGIWSWDADSVLLVNDEHVWKIEPRVDVNIDTHGTTAADETYPG